MSNLTLSATLTTTNGTAYAAGDTIGSLVTFTESQLYGNTMKRLKSVIITDASKQSSAIDIVLFGANPTGSTFTNDAAAVIPVADLTKIIGVAKVPSANYSAYSASSAALVEVDIPIFVVNSTYNLYMAVICQGTPTYTSTSAISLTLSFGRY